MDRPSGRSNNQLRSVNFSRGATKHAEGSVIAEFGDTRVLCTASVSQGVPRFMKAKGADGLRQSMACCLGQRMTV